MANRMFFFIALPGTIICFIAYTMVVFTPKYMTYDAPLPSGMKVCVVYVQQKFDDHQLTCFYLRVEIATI